MGDAWTRERVLQMAPDAASTKAGEALASTRNWGLLGRDEAAAWGECQGSGAKPYQVQVDLAEAACKCSCPSRKFPCKHGIALLLLNVAGSVPPGAQPPWVSEWLAARSQRQAKKPQQLADVPIEKLAERQEAQEQRRSKRLENMLSGMQDLKLWLEDLIRGGLAAAPARGLAHFEERAKRLVDAQAPGAARMVREIGSRVSSGTGWQTRTLEAVAMTWLLTEAASRVQQLPVEVRQDVLATLGVPTSKESLASAPGARDIWQVIGREIEIEANLKTQKTCLFGLQTRRPALLLDFAYGNAGLNSPVPVGTLYPAELAFYPGRSLRAELRTPPPEVAPMTRMEGVNSIAEVLDLHATLLGERPWLDEIAVPVANLRMAAQGDAWWLVDNAGDALPLRTRGRANWIALAVSNGAPASMGIAADGRETRLLSMVHDGIFYDLGTSHEEVAQ